MKRLSEEEKWRYSAKDLPPAKNKILYAIRCLKKLFSLAVFGIGGFLLGITVLPLLRLFVHPSSRFKKVARAFISATFRFYLFFLRAIHGVYVTTADKARFKTLSSSIIVANHPSLLDVVILIALTPNCDCIVNGALTKSVFRIIVKELYLVNTLGYEEMLTITEASLKTGANLIVFPEGTRTPRHGTNPYKRGAARIALGTGCNIQPVYIGGNDKYGLGKHDAFFSFNKNEPYRYNVSLLEPIRTEEYKNLPPPLAARRLTDQIHSAIAEKALSVDGRIL